MSIMAIIDNKAIHFAESDLPMEFIKNTDEQ
jgi:hypothetical protein